MDTEKQLTAEQTAEMFSYLRNIVNAPEGTHRPPLPDFIPDPQPQTQSQAWYDRHRPAAAAPCTQEEEELELGPEEDRMVFPDDLDLER